LLLMTLSMTSFAFAKAPPAPTDSKGGNAPVLAARAPARRGPDAAHADVEAALREGQYTFCSKPRTPLMPRQLALCPLAKETPNCEALVEACSMNTPQPTPRSSFLEAILRALGSFAQAFLWILVAIIVVVVAIPIVRALAQSRRDRQATQATQPKSRAE